MSQSPAQRDVLPIPDAPYDGEVPFDAKDPKAKFPPIEPLRPPAGAPNVLVILLDDVGFAASSAFGGPCATPTAERLAGEGLKYNRFHTTALCAPTRAALLTGRNSVPGASLAKEASGAARGQSTYELVPQAQHPAASGVRSSEGGSAAREDEPARGARGLM